MTSEKGIHIFKHPESDRPHIDDDFSLWWLILQMTRSLHKARVKELFKYKLTPEKAAVIFILKFLGHRTTPAKISRYLLREPHSVVGLLQRMEQQGLIERHKDLERKNLVRIALTEKGEEAYSISAKRESIHNIMSCLSKEDHQQLQIFLNRLRSKAFEELGEAEPPQFSSDQ